MPDDQDWAVRAKRLYEHDEGNDEEDGEQQIAARRHPSHHGHKHWVQSEHERQEQREQPLVTQSEQQPEHAETANNVQKQIGKMINKRVRPTDESVEHKTHRLEGTVKGSVGP